jgi:hypothetical protein
LIASNELRYVIQIHSEMLVAAKINGLKELPINLRQIEEWVMAKCVKQHYLPATLKVKHAARIYECSVAN